MFQETSKTILCLMVTTIFFLIFSVFLNYMKLNLEGFNDLDTIFSVPLIVQTLAIIALVLFSIFYLLKSNKIFFPAIAISVIFAFSCTYSITISSGVNSIRSDIGPIKIAEIPLTEDLFIATKWYGYLVSDHTTAKTTHLLTNVTPLALFDDDIEQYLAEDENCIEKNRSEVCVKYAISWP